MNYQCRACKLQDKQCVNDCIFAPLDAFYSAYNFEAVTTVFGLETLTFFLKELSPMERKRIALTFSSIAKSCFVGPPADRRGLLITALQNYANQTPEELSETKKLLNKYDPGRSVILALPAIQPVCYASDESESVAKDSQSEIDSSNGSNSSVVEN